MEDRRKRFCGEIPTPSDGVSDGHVAALTSGHGNCNRDEGLELVRFQERSRPRVSRRGRGVPVARLRSAM
eukprot:12919364-Prorocentrum_lima.AAC.1